MFKSTPLLMIEDAPALDELVASLADQPVIAIDTESDSFHHYREKVCLIQLSDLHRDVIIDPLKVQDLSPLARVLSNPDQVKILHGADYDIVCLKRDYNIPIRNIFDTMIAAQFLGLPGIGLADLIYRYFGHEIDKKYQRHDWARRPLETEHLDYARGDTHFLIALREVLTHKLNVAGRMGHVLEECAIIEEREWGGRGGLPEVDFMRMRGANTLDERGLHVLREVYLFRDSIAKQLDRPAFKVMPEDKLLELAARRPEGLEAVEDVLRPGSPMARKYGTGLAEAVARGIASDEPLPDARRGVRGPAQSGGASIDRLLGPLKLWRNDVMSRRNLAPTVIVSNTTLKEIARLAPADMEALAAVPGIRSWQVQDFGEELLTVVSSAAAPARTTTSRRRRRRRTGGGSAED